MSTTLADNTHRLSVRVYYEDTDAGGVVYHSNFLKYCERGRTEFLRALGIEQGRFVDMGFVVRRMVCEFVKPARLDDLLEVRTMFRESAGARLELSQEVRRETEVLFATDVTVVLIDGRGRPRRLPPEFVSKMKSLSESGS